MVMKKFPTGTITATAATYNSKLSTILGNDGPFIGRIKKIAFKVSASTDFKIYTLQGDGTTAEEYIFGASGAAVTVAASKVVYPVVLEQKASDGSNLTTYTEPVIHGDLYIAASALTAADTFEITFYMEEF